MNDIHVYCLFDATVWAQKIGRLSTKRGNGMERVRSSFPSPSYVAGAGCVQHFADKAQYVHSHPRVLAQAAGTFSVAC